MPTLSDLLSQKAELERQIADAQREERAAAIAEVRRLMDQYGLTAADLSGRSSGPRKSAAGSGSGTSKVAPKYRNTETGETWSGRGLQPNWLKKALASGKTLADFAIG
jgi:DNA-binding protein H-NS